MGSLWDLICCKIKTPTWANRMFLLQEPILACVTETWKSSIALHVIQPVLKACFCYFPFIHQLIALKACVCYFSQFLKGRCISSLFWTKYIEKKFDLQLFFPPLFHKHLFSPGLPRDTRLLETSCLEKVTVCVIETMLVTLPLVQMNKARREVNRTNLVQTKINMKGLQMSVIHLIPGSTCHWISNRMRFFKKYLSVETFSSGN